MHKVYVFISIFFLFSCSGSFGLNQNLIELKMNGLLVSRHLSLADVKTFVHEVKLHKEFRVIYNRCCQLVILFV